MSTKSLDYSNLDLLNPSSTQASWHALAFCRTPGVRALGAPRAHVLHARTRATASRPWPLLACRATPVLVHTPERSKPSPGALQRRRQSPLAARRRRQQVSAMDGAAQATRARQLPPGTARAHPQARRQALVAATSPCSYRTAVRRSYPRPPREPTLAAYKRSPELVQSLRQAQAIHLALP